MKGSGFKVKKLIAASGAVFAMLAAPLAVDHFVGGVFSSAMADSHQGNKGAGGGGGAGKGAGGQKGAGKGGKGGSIEDRVFRAEPDEDSDRPDWAGVKGGKAGGGTKPPGAGTKKGDLFGDMVVLVRDENGLPILNADGLVQVIAFVYDEEGNVVPLTDAEGNLQVIPYNTEGDLLTQMVVDGTTYSVVPAEVELGRLSVGRSPEKVLDKALTDSLSKLTGEFAVVTLDSTGRLVVDGVTIDSPLENLALYEVYMSTGEIPGVTLPDGFSPASLFAAAADKTGSIIVDTVVYMNAILGIDTTKTTAYFTTYEYDRSDTWGTKTAVVLVLQDDGTYAEETVNLYDAVFNNTDWSSETVGGAEAFAQASDDYLQVLEFVHDNAVR
ncbi:MAG: hypothetical protein AMS22_06665 [Thiotrichales bacterium SG8_50]|nr:MAG: hypothetical protein AMS22_06665 [Thiotrichales bacterium SG8_50]